MKRLLAIYSALLLVGFTQLSAQSFGGSPVKKIIDNPNSPELAQWVMEASKLQAQQKGSFNIDKIARRNLYSLILMPNGQCLARMEPLPASMLQKDFLHFLKNPEGDIMLSDSVDSSTPLTGQLYISEGMAIVNYDSNALMASLEPIREMALALQSYRDLVAFKAFKVDYAHVPALGASVMDQLFNSKLILIPELPQMGGAAPAPPAPPKDIEIPVGEEEEEIEIEVPEAESKPESGGGTFPGLPDLGEVGDLEKAAEKLKDIIFSNGEKAQDTSLASPEASNPRSPSPEANYPSSTSNEVYEFPLVDRAPVMDGCESAPSDDENKYCFERALNRYAESNFVYPVKLKGSGIIGRIYLKLIFDGSGRLVKKRVVRGIDPEVDFAATKTFENFPQLQPAEIHGKPVGMEYVLVMQVKE